MFRYTWTTRMRKGLGSLATFAAVAFGILLAPTPAAAQYPEHAHTWSVDPPLDTPYIMVDEEYPLPNDVISVTLGPISDFDTCTNQDGWCSFWNLAWNGVTLVSWSDNGAGGRFGYLDGGVFVQSTSNISHYRTPTTTGTVTLSVIVDDIPEAIDPATYLTVATADDPQKAGNQQIVVWDIVKPVSGRKQYYLSGSPGLCPVPLEATTAVNWTIEGMPNVAVDWYGGTMAEPNFFAAGSGVYRNLPPYPTSFGMKRVMASRGNRTRETYIYVFYDPLATNHPVVEGDPPGAGGWPNWYYYWRQTSANFGSHQYDAGLAYPGQVRFEGVPGAWRSFIGPSCYRAKGNPSPVFGWQLPWGIDHFAWMCRHEEQHVFDLVGEWGQNPRNPLLDDDFDRLRSDLEDQKLPGHPHGADWYSWLQKATFVDHFLYGPFASDAWSDMEDWCLHRQPGWTNDSANQEDWSQGGKMDDLLPSP